MGSHNSIERVSVPRSEVAEKLKELASIYSTGLKRIVVEDKGDILSEEERTNLELNSCIRFGGESDSKAEDVAFYLVLSSYYFLYSGFSRISIPIKYMQVFENTRELKEGEKTRMKFPNEILRYLRSFPLQP